MGIPSNLSVSQFFLIFVRRRDLRCGCISQRGTYDTGVVDGGGTSSSDSSRGGGGASSSDVSDGGGGSSSESVVGGSTGGGASSSLDSWPAAPSGVLSAPDDPPLGTSMSRAPLSCISVMASCWTRVESPDAAARFIRRIMAGVGSMLTCCNISRIVSIGRPFFCRCPRFAVAMGRARRVCIFNPPTIYMHRRAPRRTPMVTKKRTCPPPLDAASHHMRTRLMMVPFRTSLEFVARM